MEPPRLGEWIALWTLIPTDSTEDVFSAVAVDIAESVTVPAAFVSQNDSADCGLVVHGLAELPGYQRRFSDPTKDHDFRHPVTVYVA